MTTSWGGLRADGADRSVAVRVQTGPWDPRSTSEPHPAVPSKAILWPLVRGWARFGSPSATAGHQSRALGLSRTFCCHTDPPIDGGAPGSRGSTIMLPLCGLEHHEGRGLGQAVQSGATQAWAMLGPRRGSGPCWVPSRVSLFPLIIALFCPFFFAQFLVTDQSKTTNWSLRCLNGGREARGRTPADEATVIRSDRSAPQLHCQQLRTSGGAQWGRGRGVHRPIGPPPPIFQGLGQLLFRRHKFSPAPSAQVNLGPKNLFRAFGATQIQNRWRGAGEGTPPRCSLSRSSVRHSCARTETRVLGQPFVLHPWQTLVSCVLFARHQNDTVPPRFGRFAC